MRNTAASLLAFFALFSLALAQGSVLIQCATSGAIYRAGQQYSCTARNTLNTNTFSLVAADNANYTVTPSTIEVPVGVAQPFTLTFNSQGVTVDWSLSPAQPTTTVINIAPSAPRAVLQFTPPGLSIPVGVPSGIWLVTIDNLNYRLDRYESLTFSLASTAGGAVFDPPTITLSSEVRTGRFSVTSQTAASFSVVASITSANPLYYNVVPSQSVDAVQRAISITVPADVNVGAQSNSIVVSVSTPIPVGQTVTLTPQATNVTFSPASVQLSATVSQVNVFFVSSYRVNNVNLYWSMVDSTGLYAQPANNTISSSQATIQIAAPAVATYFVTQPSQTFTLTLPFPVINDLAINVSTSNAYVTINGGSLISFAAGSSTATFTAVANTLQRATTQQTVFGFSLFGTDRLNYNVPSLPTAFTWTRIPLRTNAVNLGNYACGKSVKVTVSADYPLPNGITITPVIDNLSGGGLATVVPAGPQSLPAGASSLIFTINDVTAQPILTFNVYGADFPNVDITLIQSPLVLSFFKTSIFATSGGVVYPGGSITVSVGIAALPQTGITITPVLDNIITTAPVALSWTPTSQFLIQTFTVQIPESQPTPTSFTVRYQISGADVQCYDEALSSNTIAVSQVSVTTTADGSAGIRYNVPATDPSTFNSRIYTVTLNNVQAPVTINLSAKDSVGVVYPATFYPSNTLTFNPNQKQQTFKVSGSARPSVGASSTITVVYTPVGAAANYLSGFGPTVSFTPVPIVVTAPATSQWGSTATVNVSIGYSTPVDLTIIPAANDRSIITPTALQFVAGGPAWQTFTVNPLAAGPVVISYTFSGTDTYMYSAPTPATSSINFQTGAITIQTLSGSSSFSAAIGVPYTFVIKAAVAPAVPINLVMTGPFTFNPAVVVLSGLSATGTFTATETTPVDSQISFNIGTTGAQALYYTNSSIAVNIPQYTVTISCPSNQKIVIGQASKICTVYLQQAPASGLTVTLASPDATFTPATLTFSSTSSAATFTFTSTKTDDTNAQSIVITPTLSGTDAAYFTAGPLTISFAAVNPYFFTTVTYSPPGNAQRYFGQSYTVTLTAQAVQTSVTVTPQSNTGDVVFSPSSVTFTPTSLVQTFTVTAMSYTATVSPVITYAVSGPDAVLFTSKLSAGVLVYKQPITPTSQTLSYALAPVLTSLNTFVSNVIGSTNVYTVTLGAAPSRGLTVAITSVDGVVVTPATLSWTPSSPLVQSFTVQADRPVNAGLLQFEFSGPSATDYSTATFLTVRTVTFTPIASKVYVAGIAGTDFASVFAAATTFHGIGTTKPYTIVLAAPVATDLTITPVCPDVVFSPASLTLNAGQAYATFNATYTTSVTPTTINYALSGTDALRFASPTATQLSLELITLRFADQGLNTFNQKVYEVAAVWTANSRTATPNFPFSATFTPTASGFTFSPATFSVNQSQPSLMVIVTSNAPAITSTVNFGISGADAARFVPSSLVQTITANGPVTPDLWAPSTSSRSLPGSNVLVGTPLTISLNIYPGTPTATFGLATDLPAVQVDIAATVPGIFSQQTFQLSGQSTSITFTFTPTQTASRTLDFPYKISGPGSVYFVPEGVINGYNAVLARQLSIAPPPTFSTNPAVLSLGQTTEPWVVNLATSVLDVTITPVCADGSVTFNPTSIRLNSASSASFTITGSKVNPRAIVNYVLSGPSAPYVSITATGLRTSFTVTPLFILDEVPTLKPKVISDPISLSVNSPVTIPTVVQVVAGNCLVNPNIVVFTPTVSTNTFTVKCPTASVTQSIALLVTDPTTNAQYYPSFQVGTNPKTASNLVTGYGIKAPAGSITMVHPRYQHTVAGKIKITVPFQPESDFTMQLISGNIEFSPAFITFTKNGPTTIEVKGTPKYSSTADVDYVASTITYSCQGSNANSYVCPSTSSHFVAIQPGYVAAAVLVPIVFVIICAVLFAVFRSRSGSYGTSKSVDIALKSQ